MSDMKNLMITLFLSLMVMIGWYWWYEKPRMEVAQEALRVQQAKLQEEKKRQKTETLPIEQLKPALSRAEALKNEGGRVQINSPRLHGSFALKGARLDDVTLAKYHETVDKNSPEVVLLSPSRTALSYFAEFGWLAPKGDVKVPDANTIWTADKSILTPEQPVTLSWDNGQGQRFLLHISLDKHFMFSIRQEVENNAAQPVELMPYGIINRNWRQEHQNYLILHEGPLGVLGGSLQEETYSNLVEDKRLEYKDNNGGWLGITDKYWLTALVPAQDKKFDGNFHYSNHAGQQKFQADYLAETQVIAAGAKATYDLRFFAGAKEISVLDRYATDLQIPLFDRAVDLGYLYFLTKPIFLALNFFFTVTGNFGLAILILTILLKVALFPMANKSYISMSQMKRLQPDIMRLRELYKDDKMRLNKEVMELYRREKVNPMSGCLPILIQIPVFFALYKVLFVTIEMRHAPFFGWIQDLSAPDPTSLFNLFGLLPYHPPSFLMIGVWPLVMGLTMYLQQKLQPMSSDPVQTQVMRVLPFIFVFLFATFPAGLIIYWAWSNTLSIIQQWVIQRRVMQKEKRR